MREARLGRDDRVGPLGDVRERPTVDDGWRAFEGLHEVGVHRVLQEHRHGAGRVEVGRVEPLAGLLLATHEDPSQPRLEVGLVLGETENGHNLARRGDVEPALPREPHRLPSEPQHDVPQRPVVHVDDALPQHGPRFEREGVPEVQVVVEQGSEQVVGGPDGVEVAGEVEVDVLHRDHLGVAAASRATLHAHDGTEGWLPKHDAAPLADLSKALGQRHRRGGLALPRLRGRHRRDED